MAIGKGSPEPFGCALAAPRVKNLPGSVTAVAHSFRNVKVSQSEIIKTGGIHLHHVAQGRPTHFPTPGTSKQKGHSVHSKRKSTASPPKARIGIAITATIHSIERVAFSARSLFTL
ncbi:hypothetical protein [Pelagibacterium lentulum]|uniref:hypothetical protein n=1 Tax=Pelagibacterium lentulum TaxID=2029865 RepID=UPI000F8C4EA6|nr:hypothetical protein [Pelagibacterium lentulum]